MVSLFFSYSHKDEELRNELDKHLSILKRQNIINSWHDRCITAGDEFDAQISQNLKTAQIILLLISPDFLASDYCYEKEMELAITRHETNDAVVIPIILRPCDWQQTPFGRLLAVPKDGKPVIKFPTLDEAFLEVTNEIKKVIKSKFAKQNDGIENKKIVQQPATNFPRSSNLKIKKTFSDQERDKFLDDAFDYIANYFEGSLNELKRRNPQIDYRFKKIDSQSFTTSIYVDGQKKAECMIFYGSFMGMSKGISFSHQISHARNSFNESFFVNDDGYMLYLKPTGLSYRSEKDEALTFEGAAEIYWEKLIGPLQRN